MAVSNDDAVLRMQQGSRELHPQAMRQRRLRACDGQGRSSGLRSNGETTGRTSGMESCVLRRYESHDLVELRLSDVG